MQQHRSMFKINYTAHGKQTNPYKQANKEQRELYSSPKTNTTRPNQAKKREQKQLYSNPNTNTIRPHRTSTIYQGRPKTTTTNQSEPLIKITLKRPTTTPNPLQSTMRKQNHNVNKTSEHIQQQTTTKTTNTSPTNYMAQKLLTQQLQEVIQEIKQNTHNNHIKREDVLHLLYKGIEKILLKDN
ncbi:hypothetical protein CHS0354_031997 [Potamilus streckersoni]|uniref:Uncharacterized protein n=1 Tax=Potamilus streckersoni TaxID=2493646 RepID=A0AAE0TMT3_9BIVA|nr:hypothetical protein CHS0354_031997 [Potamilus streckersoni]